VAIGRTGGGFDFVTCGRLWTLPKTIVNPQELSIAQLDPAPLPLSITVTQRGSGTTESNVLDASSKVVRKIADRVVPMQNAELDRDRRTDELVSMFGEIFNGAGQLLLSSDWYWNLKGTKVVEVPGETEYDRWTAFPVLFDVDKDGRDELVT
jgi:hypothetical protein